MGCSTAILREKFMAIQVFLKKTIKILNKQPKLPPKVSEKEQRLRSAEGRK